MSAHPACASKPRPCAGDWQERSCASRYTHPMRIVIAGGTGLIGRALSWHFVAAGDEVTVLTRGGAARQRVIEGARTVEWGSALGSWTSCLDGADVLVNLCGASIADGRWTPARKEELEPSL